MQTVQRRLLLCGAAGALLGLASPPFDLLAGLWLGMGVFAWLLTDDREVPAFAAPARVALTGARRGLAFGIGANLVALRFIPGVVERFTPLPWVAGCVGLGLLAAFEGTRWMVAGVACETLVRARVPRPVAFAAGVYAGTFTPTMFPWTPAGGVSPWVTMVQLADVVGERGVTALMALVAALGASAAAAALRRETRRRAAFLAGAGLALLGAQGAFGVARMRAIERARSGVRVRVALVQPAIAATTRWQDDRAPALLAGLGALTERAANQGAQLVVWPEAAYPYRLPHGVRRMPDTLRGIVPPGVSVPVLAGLLMTRNADGSATNSALLAAPDGGLSESYDKRHLLWFGETVPLADRLPWLRRVFARGLGLSSGDSERLLVAGPLRAAVLICYEDTLPEAGREADSVAPNVLVNLTNDAWFTGSAESELHLRLAALRAIELRRDLVRSVNGGPTSWIDASGRVRARASPEFASVTMAEPTLSDAPPTVYSRFGDAPWTLALLVFANAAVWRRALRSDSATTE